jgi:hypothetical protein
MRRQDIAKVLETRGRMTPTLMRAPRLQWDLSKPFTPSMSTLRTKCSSPLSIVEDVEENEEVVYDKDDKQDIEEGNELVQDGTLIFAIVTREHIGYLRVLRSTQIIPSATTNVLLTTT